MTIIEPKEEPIPSRVEALFSDLGVAKGVKERISDKRVAASKKRFRTLVEDSHAFLRQELGMTQAALKEKGGRAQTRSPRPFAINRKTHIYGKGKKSGEKVVDMGRRASTPFLLAYLFPFTRKRRDEPFPLEQAWSKRFQDLVLAADIHPDPSRPAPYPYVAKVLEWQHNAEVRELSPLSELKSPGSKARQNLDAVIHSEPGFDVLPEPDPMDYAKGKERRAANKYRQQVRRQNELRRNMMRQRNAAVQNRTGHSIANAGSVSPANLYVTEIGPELRSSLDAQAMLFIELGISPGLAEVLLRVSYFMLALAKIPVWQLYSQFHGTATIEHLLPDLNRSRRTFIDLAESQLEAWVSQERTNDGERSVPLLFTELDKRALQAYVRWVRHLLGSNGLKSVYAMLARTASSRSVNRVHTPARFTDSGQWLFEVSKTEEEEQATEPDRGQEETQSQEAETETFLATERLIYPGDEKTSRKKITAVQNQEIWWMHRRVHPVLTAAAALMNQSGATLAMNAANNRWGGKHPPHQTSHVNGFNLDTDTGAVWRHDWHRIPDIKKRDGSAVFSLPAPGAKNEERPTCLHGMDRLLAWIHIQAFLISGVTKYLYGDANVMIEPVSHLQLLIEDIDKKADGRLEQKAHYNHFHLTFPWDTVKQDGPYAFQRSNMTNADLFKKLRELAEARDQDPNFWLVMTGRKEFVPTEVEHFNGLDEAEDWKAWYSGKFKGEAWRSPGLKPLLPVWDPTKYEETYAYGKCRDLDIDKLVEIMNQGVGKE